MLSTNDRQFLIGFDRAFAQINNVLNNQSKYPPHDIVRLDETRYQIILAVAGFTKDDIDVTLEAELLTITGNKKTPERTYVFNGISNRPFTKAFKLHETVKVNGAKVEDGLLTIDLEEIVPETKKPLKIALQ